MNKRVIEFSVLSIVALLALMNVNGVSTISLAQSATPAATPASQDITFPDLTGPYKVGRTEYEWVDQSRDEKFASIPGLKRDLMVYVWFPAAAAKRTKLAPYMDADLAWDIFTRHPGLDAMVHTHAYSTSILDTSKPSYPVLVFIHGLPATSFVYASIIEEMVSHGYIVVGTSHPYSTGVIIYPDGRTVVAGAVDQAFTLDLTTLVQIWSQDVRFVLDQVEKLNTSDDTFKGHLDLNRIGVFGQSFGGATAAEVTFQDSRVKAGANMDGFMYADELTYDIGKPFFFLGEHAGPKAVQMTHDKFWLTINGIAHLNYGDFGLLLPLTQTFCRYGIDQCINMPSDLGTIDPVRALQIVNSYLLVFFDHYLNGAA